MNQREVVRLACDECHIVFDLCIAPLSEWVELLDDKDFEDTEIEAPSRCPFCELSELRLVHDRTMIVGADAEPVA